MKLRRLSSIILLFTFSLFLFSCEGDIFETDAQIIVNISKTWTAVDSDGVTFDIVIAGKSTTEVNMFNFNSFGASVATVGTVTGKRIVISPQTVDGEGITGSGTINDDYTSISFVYSVNDGGGDEDFTASLTEYVAPVKKAEKVQ